MSKPMSDQWGGPGWWYASDGKWYPPHGEAATAFDLDDRVLETVASGSGQRLSSEEVDLLPGAMDVAPTDAALRNESRGGRVGATEIPPIDLDDNVREINLDDLDLDALDQESRLLSGSSVEAPPRSPWTDIDRPASVTRTTVGPTVRPRHEDDDLATTSSPDSDRVDFPSAEPGDPVFGTGTRPVRRESALFAVAVALAAVTGILGALWLRERSAVVDLRTEVETTRQLGGPNETIEELERQNNTLRIQNAQLEQQLIDMSALVLELPEGRVTEIDVPIDPLFADEENGRLIAVDADGGYVVFGDGADNAITDSGRVDATPTGLFAATAKAWVSTEAGMVQILALTPNADVQEDVTFGPVEFLAPDSRGYWTYDEANSQVVRLRKADGRVTDEVQVPVGIADLTIGAGSVWALGDDGLVYRINTADLTLQPIDAGDDLVSISAAPDALWTLSASDGSLRRIDPVTGEVLVTVPVGRDPIDATFAGSSVWVALRSGSSLIEVDTRTSAVVSRTELADEPSALFQGETGVYVTTAGNGAPLVRIDSLIPTVDPDADEVATVEGALEDGAAEDSAAEASDGS